MRLPHTAGEEGVVVAFKPHATPNAPGGPTVRDGDRKPSVSVSANEETNGAAPLPRSQRNQQRRLVTII